MALAFAAHVARPGWERVVGVAAMVTLSAVSYRGITRTARLTMVIVTPSWPWVSQVVSSSPADGTHEAARADPAPADETRGERSPWTVAPRPSSVRRTVDRRPTCSTARVLTPKPSNAPLES